jgi:hypothetical protein
MATSGVVTIGGRPVDGRPGRIRVVASREGVGVLNLAMGVETTASADGRFELRGLSPGSHLVQAIRDDLWASPAVELIATEEAPLPELTLDIPEPGAPVALTLDGPDGLPAADRPIRVLRPDGPLSGSWPEGLRTDLEGSIILRGLEAGTHQVAVEGEADPVSIDVPPIVPGQHPGPIAVRAVVGPPGG